jgi:hypothetical protein
LIPAKIYSMEETKTQELLRNLDGRRSKWAGSKKGIP